MNAKILNDFNNAIKDSVPNKDTQEVSPNRHYYKDDYLKPVQLYYCLTNRKSNEFARIDTSSGIRPYKMASVCSSARLCFIRLAEEANVIFEYHLLNCTSKSEIWEKPNRNDTQLDAFDGETFYECKCQEIFHDKGYLSKSYKPFLRKYLGLTEIRDDGKNIVGSPKELKIEIENVKDYRKTYFDLKQLFTHLCAINKEAHKTGNRYLLKYIFFKPSQTYIDKNNDIAKAYETLEKEIQAIKKSDIFKNANNFVDFDYEYVFVDSESMKKDPKIIFFKKYKEYLRK